MLPPASELTLVGSLVRLRPLVVGDASPLLDAANEDRSRFSFTLVPADEPSMRRYIQTALDDRDTGWSVPFAIESLGEGRVVGTTRFLDLDYWSDTAPWPPGRPKHTPGTIPSAGEIGSTWLARSTHATGVNSDAKLLMMSHAFEVWKVQRITLKTDARNLRSRRAIEHLGAQFEGVRRRHTPTIDGTVRDSAYYSILTEEWPAIRDHLTGLLDRHVTRRPPSTDPNTAPGTHHAVGRKSLE